VRIHPGNTAADTEGCILPGLARHAAGVWQSRAAFDPLFARIKTEVDAGHEVRISISTAA
jgi:hypothetical protein